MAGLVPAIHVLLLQVHGEEFEENTMIIAKLTNDLKKSVVGRHNPFETYKQFGRRFGFSTDYCPSWANRPVLDAVAAALRSDPDVGLDLTFLIRNGSTGYPSVIDGKPYDESEQSKKRAHSVAEQIIKKYHLSVSNPY
jgi:hypothetical protein